MAATLGIYFGPKIICVVEINGKKVLNYLKIPRALLNQDELEEKIPEEVKLVTVLGEEFKKNNIRAKEAVIGLSGAELLVRTFELPILPQAELPNAINFEAKKYIPFKVEDLQSNFQVEVDRKAKKNFVLFAGIKSDLLEKYNSIFKQLGIKISHIDYAPFSVLRFLALSGFKDKGVVGLLSLDLVEEDEVNFTVLDKGVPVFSRDITLPRGLPAESAQPVSTEDIIGKLKTELRISLDYYKRKFPQKKLSTVLFVAEQGLRGDLESQMAEMELSAKFIDFSQNIYIGKDQPFSLSFIKSYGSGLWRAVRIRLKLDILAAKPKLRVIKKAEGAAGEGLSALIRSFKLDVRFLILGLLIYGAAYAYGLYRSHPVNQEKIRLISIRPEVKSVTSDVPLNKLKEIDSSFENKISDIDNTINNQLFLTGPMESVARNIPKDMWIKNFSFKVGKDNRTAQLTMRGLIYSEGGEEELTQANAFVAKLKEDPAFNKYFNEIKIISLEEQLLGQVTVTSFSIECKRK